MQPLNAICEINFFIYFVPNRCFVFQHFYSPTKAMTFGWETSEEIAMPELTFTWLTTTSSSGASGTCRITNSNISFTFCSFHELGIYDVRAQTDFIVNYTSREIIYIGYSMGTTAGFVYSSMYPQRAKKNMRAMILLAPVAYFVDVPSIINFFPPIWGPVEVKFFEMHVFKYPSRI